MSFVQTRFASRQFFPDIKPVNNGPDEWIMRSGNFVVSFAKCVAGEKLNRDNIDEHFLYLPEGAAQIKIDGQVSILKAGEVAIIPPGKSEIIATEAALLIRIFTNKNQDLLQKSINKEIYQDGAPEISKPISWPDPIGGFKLRVYSLSDYADRPMRMFRTKDLMINIFDFQGPRDTKALSPHHHDDFEQGSLAITGDWVHALRYPWSKNLADWRDDEHLQIKSPSLLIIPAKVIHTSRPVTEGNNQLLDIFSPPRMDFAKLNWVCNSDEYPELPEA